MGNNDDNGIDNNKVELASESSYSPSDTGSATRSIPHEGDMGSSSTEGLRGGDTVGEWTLEHLIGQGGCSVVFGAVHQRSGQRAAVKVLRNELSKSPSMVERFIREIRAVDRIDHPFIVDMYDFGKLSDGRPYYAMELLEGMSLRELGRSRGILPAEEVLELLEPICQALQAAHDAGYVHRDMKSSNVMVSSDGKRVTLLDFGIAKLLHPEPSEAGLTSVGRRLGTLHAMAPEQIECGPVDARTDIYALGVLCFELLTARRPFTGMTWAEIEWLHLSAPPPAPSRFAPVSPAVETVVLRCLEKSPDRRYGSAIAFLEALRQSILTGPAPVMNASPKRDGDDDQSALEGYSGNAKHRDGIAMLLEVRQPSSHAIGMEDSIIDSLVMLLHASEVALRGAGFEIALRTSSALLAVTTLPDELSDESGENSEARACRQRTLDLAVDLHDSLSGSDVRDKRLCISVVVHVAALELAPTSDTAVGGELLELGAWTSPNECGVYGTPSALSGLVHPRISVLE